MASRLVFGLLEVFCERILLEHDWVPVRDLPALMVMPEPIVYKATADRISRLPYGQLFVAFYGRIAEALIANTLADLDAAQRRRELLSPPPDPLAPASPVTAPKQ